MNKERLIGFLFSISLLLVTLFVFLTPQIDYQQEFKVEEKFVIEEPIDKKYIIENASKKETSTPKTAKPNEINISVMDESYFDLYVMRVHVLSSEKNALDMVLKINEGGLPAFTELFGENKNLHAVYVGPFLTEKDITENLELIHKISESKNGEVSRWKL